MVDLSATVSLVATTAAASSTTGNLLANMEGDLQRAVDKDLRTYRQKDGLSQEASVVARGTASGLAPTGFCP